MEAFWVITTLEERGNHVNEITSSKWGNEATPEAEWLGLLNLVKETNNKTKRLTGGKIKTHSDKKKVINGVLNEINKERKYTQAARATIETVNREKSKATIEIYVEHSTNKPGTGKTFQQELGLVLVKECDEKSKELRHKLSEEHEEKTPCIGSTTPIHNGVMKDKAVNILIREVDAQHQEEEYVNSKIPEH